MFLYKHKTIVLVYELFKMMNADVAGVACVQRRQGCFKPKGTALPNLLSRQIPLRNASLKYYRFILPPSNAAGSAPAPGS
jgi:hypothetical protein